MFCHLIILTETVKSERDVSSAIYGLGSNWENMLTPVPVSVSLLASMLHGSMVQTDFSLMMNHKGQFCYLKHPESYRVSCAVCFKFID